MKSLLILFTACLLFSCGKKSAIGKQLSGSDSLVINFNIPNSDTIAKTITTVEEKAIKKLAGFADSKNTEAYKCGYDGNILFYAKSKLLGDVAFNYSGDGCKHFILSVDDKLTPTAMSSEAADFLKSLAEGKGWY